MAIYGGILKILGKERQAMVIFIFGNTVIGLTSAYTIGIHYNQGVVGVWQGMFIGGTVTMVLFLIWIYNLDIEIQVKKIVERV